MPKLYLVHICRKTREQRYGGSWVLLMTTRDIIHMHVLRIADYFRHCLISVKMDSSVDKR